ncbi:MAG: AEC family transporter [Opitutales bacterium]|jgi:predicted permease
MEVGFGTILGAALPVFLLLGAGYGLRRWRVLSAEADASLLKLVIRILYPCLYFDYVIGNPALKGGGNLIAPPLVGFLTVSGGFLIAYLAGKLGGLRTGKGLRTFSFGNGIYNYGFIPIPVMIALFDDRGVLGVLLVYNVGVELAIWTIGVMLLAGQFERAALKNLLNPPVLALAVALVVNVTGLDAVIPGWMETTVSMLAGCCVPLGILLAGALIADLLAEQPLLADLEVLTGSVVIRLTLLPFLFLVAAAFLPGISSELRQVLVIQAAMPAGIMPIVLARHFGGDTAVAIRIVLATTLCSVVTMPLWIHFGIRFVL